MPISAAGDWPACSVSRSTWTPFAERRRLGDPIGGDDRDGVEPLHVPQRAEHVGEHRLRERLARAAAEQAAEALLGGAEALDREDRDGAHRAEVRL